MKPLFIFSLPRSGSTLLQRTLSADKKISSLAEPWLLLPLVYSLKNEGIYTEYSHQIAKLALDDFVCELPNGKQDFFSAIGEATLSLYGKASKNKNAKYFLDKTPRYALISDEIIQIFPDGKFIFLWRNPLAVIASLLETFGRGRWYIFKFKVDLFDGILKLIDSYNEHQNVALSIQYETFLQCPKQELKRIEKYLDLDLSSELLGNFSQVTFSGRMGDPTGINQYDELNKETLEKWKLTLNNPFRKWWCRRYLHWLGHERLQMMGYDLNGLIQELNSSKSTFHNLISDIAWTIYGFIYCFIEIPALKYKLNKFPAMKWIKRYD